jgi:hypothetical protein
MQIALEPAPGSMNFRIVGFERGSAAAETGIPSSETFAME